MRKVGALLYPAMKPCRKCGQVLPRSEFYPAPTLSSPNAVRAYCKTCHKKDTQKWQKQDREAHKLLHRRKQTARNHGFTLVEYDAIFAQCGEKCQICGAASSSDGRKLAIDHCGKTNRFRGVLCDLCNRGLGLFQDRPDLLIQAAKYLNNPLGKQTKHRVDNRRLSKGTASG